MIINKIRIVWLALFLTGLTAGIRAQNDTTFNELLQEFSYFQQQTASEMQSFFSKNDSLFLQFLENSWEEYKVFEIKRDEKPKPLKQPVMQDISEIEEPEIHTNPSGYKVSLLEKQTGSIHTMEPKKYETLAIMKSFELFGKSFDIQLNNEHLMTLENINEKSITEYYKYLSRESALWDANLSSLLKKKEAYRFNDWGFYLILREASKQIYPRPQEQMLFIWYSMIQCGYQVKIGYAGEKVYLLIPSLHDLYQIPYLSDQGLKYYLFGQEADPSEKIKSYAGFYKDNARIFSFSLSSLPYIKNTEVLYKKLSRKDEVIQLSFQKGLLDYLSSVPQSELSVYFDPPLQEETQKALDAILLPLMQEKTNLEKVNILLEFVQTAIPYLTDREQFGKERYLYAEEVLYYNGADCEDRTILLKQLVLRYTGLPTVSLEYPNHVSMAVSFPGATQGDHVLVNGKEYLICDPTFINAGVGMLPLGLQHIQPEIIIHNFPTE